MNHRQHELDIINMLEEALDELDAGRLNVVVVETVQSYGSNASKRHLERTAKALESLRKSVEADIR